jgi:hypothetical protein
VSADSAGTAADVCPGLQRAADDALTTLVNANNACDTDADCADALGVGPCYTYCEVLVRRSNVEVVMEAGRQLCRSYIESGCTVGFACPNSPGAACSNGHCALKF